MTSRTREWPMTFAGKRALPAIHPKNLGNRVRLLTYSSKVWSGERWVRLGPQCMKAHDLCRWVGHCGCRNDRGGNCSWWSCALAGSTLQHTPRGRYTEPDIPGQVQPGERKLLNPKKTKYFSVFFLSKKLLSIFGYLN